jgi:hypothetical protein
LPQEGREKAAAIFDLDSERITFKLEHFSVRDEDSWKKMIADVAKKYQEGEVGSCIIEIDD